MRHLVWQGDAEVRSCGWLEGTVGCRYPKPPRPAAAKGVASVQCSALHKRHRVGHGQQMMAMEAAAAGAGVAVARWSLRYSFSFGDGQGRRCWSPVHSSSLDQGFGFKWSRDPNSLYKKATADCRKWTDKQQRATSGSAETEDDSDQGRLPSCIQNGCGHGTARWL